MVRKPPETPRRPVRDRPVPTLYYTPDLLRWLHAESVLYTWGEATCLGQCSCNDPLADLGLPLRGRICRYA